MNNARSYKLLGILGRGGFGTVYLAELKGSGGFSKRVALKVLRDDLQVPKETAVRFRDEARILGLLRHRAVVGIDSLAQLEDGWGVVMEYIPGVDVGKLTKKNLPPPAIGLQIVEEVASALHAAYEAPSYATGQPLRLIHRDIKPANIRLTDHGEVKVLDFGASRADFKSREAHTKALLFGSLRYMGAERLTGKDTHTGDIYSLGVLLTELLAGDDFEDPPRHPKQHRALFEARLAIAKERIADPEVAARIEDLVLRMVDYDHQRRPRAKEVETSCQELCDALDGQRLRVWAEEHVPPLAAESTQNDFAGVDSILFERSDVIDLSGTGDLVSDTFAMNFGGEPAEPTPADEPREPPPPPPPLVEAGPTDATPQRTRRIRTWALPLAVAIAGLAVAAALFGRPAPVVVQTLPTPVIEDVEDEPVVETPDAAPEDLEPEVLPEAAGVEEPVEEPVEELVEELVEPAPEVPVQTPKRSPRARLGLEGDAIEVVLLSRGGQRVQLGRVPPGEYQILARFEESGGDTRAGSVSLVDKEDAVLFCSAAMMMCTKK